MAALFLVFLVAVFLVALPVAALLLMFLAALFLMFLVDVLAVFLVAPPFAALFLMLLAAVLRLKTQSYSENYPIRNRHSPARSFPAFHFSDVIDYKFPDDCQVVIQIGRGVDVVNRMDIMVSAPDTGGCYLHEATLFYRTADQND